MYIVGTVAGVVGGILLWPVLDAQDYLVEFSAKENEVRLGALFTLIMAVAVAGIAINIYPILRKCNESLALWCVGARITESVIFIGSAFSIVMLLTLSQDFVEAGSPSASYYQTLGDSYLAAGDWLGVLADIVAFGLYTLFFYYLLYRSRLVPRFLSVWGFVGGTLCIVAGLSVMFGANSSSMAVITLYLPIAVNEMVLAGWLIVKGFNQSALASFSSKASEESTETEISRT